MLLCSLTGVALGTDKPGYRMQASHHRLTSSAATSAVKETGKSDAEQVSLQVVPRNLRMDRAEQTMLRLIRAGRRRVHLI